MSFDLVTLGLCQIGMLPREWDNNLQSSGWCILIMHLLMSV